MDNRHHYTYHTNNNKDNDNDNNQDLMRQKQTIMDSIYYQIESLNKNSLGYYTPIQEIPQLNVLNAALLFMAGYQNKSYLNDAILANPSYAQAEVFELVASAIQIMKKVNPEASNAIEKPTLNEIDTKLQEIQKHLTTLYNKYTSDDCQRYNHNPSPLSNSMLLQKIKVLEATLSCLSGKIDAQELNAIAKNNPQYNDGETGKLFHSALELINKNYTAKQDRLERFSQSTVSQPLDPALSEDILNNHFLFSKESAAALSLTCRKYHSFFSRYYISPEERHLKSIQSDYKNLLKEKNITHALDLIPACEWWRFFVDGSIQEQYGRYPQDFQNLSALYQEIADKAAHLQAYSPSFHEISCGENDFNLEFIQQLYSKLMSETWRKNTKQAQAIFRKTPYCQNLDANNLSKKYFNEIINNHHETYFSITPKDYYFSGYAPDGQTILLDKKSLYKMRKEAKMPQYSDLRPWDAKEVLSLNKMIDRLEHEILSKGLEISSLEKRIALTNNNENLLKFFGSLCRKKTENDRKQNLGLRVDLAGKQLEAEIKNGIDKYNDSILKAKNCLDKLKAIISFVQLYGRLQPFELSLNATNESEKIIFFTMLLIHLLVKNNFPPPILPKLEKFYGYTVDELIMDVVQGMNTTLTLLKQGKVYGFTTASLPRDEDARNNPWINVEEYLEEIFAAEELKNTRGAKSLAFTS
jgi:hypothetical protein